jgi:hypothetical protein
MKGAALPATSDMLAATRASLERSLDKFGDIAPRVATRKAVLIEFDSYKRKVETLRAAPPKNDPEKLPRNEEKRVPCASRSAALLTRARPRAQAGQGVRRPGDG